VGRSRYMSVSTGSASVSRGKVSLLLHALLQSSLGLRSHGPGDPSVRLLLLILLFSIIVYIVIDITVFCYCLYGY